MGQGRFELPTYSLEGFSGRIKFAKQIYGILTIALFQAELLAQYNIELIILFIKVIELSS